MKKKSISGPFATQVASDVIRDGLGMKRASSAFVVLGACFFASASAASDPRFATQQITRAEWKQLYELVRKEPDAGIRRRHDHIVITVPSSEYVSTYVFTRPGHPAHPAVVIHDALVSETEHWAELSSHFAGRQSAFEAWKAKFRFNEYAVYPP